MEELCTPEKRDTVKAFLEIPNIEVWGEPLNPVLDPEVSGVDKRKETERRQILHFTRIIMAWWKAANFVERKYTAQYYQNLINLEVQSPNKIYQWPASIEGIAIDAREFEEAKENPSITFESKEGPNIVIPSNKGTRKPKPHLCTLETFGTHLAAPASKRQRPDDPNNDRRKKPKKADTHARQKEEVDDILS